MPPSPSSFSSTSSVQRKHWWISKRKIVDRYIRDAKFLIATQEESEVASAVSLLDSALTLSPQHESAIELKARYLLYLGRFKDVVNMFPSLRVSLNDVSTSSSLLNNSSQPGGSPKCKCLSVSHLKDTVKARLGKNCKEEHQWRYLVLGQACFHLGLMDDALVLLQTAKRIASAASQRKSIYCSDDSFSFSTSPITGDRVVRNRPHRTEFETISHLLGHIKFLCSRKTSAMAALNAGLYAEAIRNFSKIVESRHGAPQGFLAECYMHRASAYRCAGRIVDSLADCNRALAMDPSCIDALHTRAALFETIRCLTDSLHDLEHLKLLYNTILRERKVTGLAWKRQYVDYRDIPGKLVTLAKKIQSLKQRVASGETGNVNYYALLGLMRGCSRSELERAHLLLILRHKPDKSNAFIYTCEFPDSRDVDSARERAKASSLLLYRLIQNGYNTITKTILDEEAVEKQRKKASAALQAADAMQQVQQTQQEKTVIYKQHSDNAVSTNTTSPRISNCNNKPSKPAAATAKSMFQGVSCRDIAAVGNSRPHFNLSLAV